MGFSVKVTWGTKWTQMTETMIFPPQFTQEQVSPD
jgi:hypothetical protein